MTMMTTWLIELYLNQIGDLKDRGLDARPDRERIEEEFRKLLVQGRVKVCKFPISMYHFWWGNCCYRKLNHMMQYLRCWNFACCMKSQRFPLRCLLITFQVNNQTLYVVFYLHIILFHSEHFKICFANLILVCAHLNRLCYVYFLYFPSSQDLEVNLYFWI